MIESNPLYHFSHGEKISHPLSLANVFWLRYLLNRCKVTVPTGRYGAQTGFLQLGKSSSHAFLPTVLCEHPVCARHHAKRFIEVVHPVLVIWSRGRDHPHLMDEKTEAPQTYF